MSVARLSYPALRREPVGTANGWYSIPWTADGVLRTLRGGGWFGPDTQFAPGVAGFAKDAASAIDFLLRG
jgi:hypothetical protein